MKVGNICDRRWKAGFSLIEAVAVLVVLAVLAFFVAVGSRGSQAALAADAEILRSHLRFTQALAMANNTCTWGISITEQGYTLQQDGDPSPLNLPGENSPSRSLSPSVRIVQGTGVHEFCPWGCPGTTMNITLSDGQRSEQISVLSFTGLVQ